ncbi:MAG: acyltransferase family protein [Lachnospiraceae bacterium]
MDKREKYDYIDTLRFLATLLIVFVHFDCECFNYFMGSTVSEKLFSPEYWTGWILYGCTGKFALAVLCIISGFLTAMKYHGKENCDVGAFLISRYLRLMLPVLVLNILFVIRQLCVGEPVDILMCLRAGIVPGDMTVNRNLWCIDSFLIGNVLVCLLCYLKNRIKWADWLYLPVMAVLLLAGQTWVLAVVAGGLSFIAASLLKEKKIVNYWWLIGIIPFLWWLIRGEETDIMYYRDILAGFIIMIVFYCLPVLQKIFAFKHMKALKKISYSLFIVHGMTLFIVGPSWNLLQMLGISSYAGTFIGLFALVFLFDLLVAIVLYYLAEVKICGILNRWLLPLEKVRYQRNEE